MANILITVNDQGLFSMQLDRFEWQSLTVNGTPVTKQPGDVQFQMPPTAGPIHFLATADKNIVLVNPGGNLMYLLSDDQKTTYLAMLSYSSTDSPTEHQVSVTGVLMPLPYPLPTATAGPAIQFSQGRMTGTFQRVGWTKLPLSNPSDYATAICVDQTANLYAGVWNPGTAAGASASAHVDRWAASVGTATNVGGDSSFQVFGMCADSFGNIYVANGTLGEDTVINIYSPTAPAATAWTSAGNNLNGQINYIGCDTANNIYVTGNFLNANQTADVLQYNPSSTTWTDLGGGFPYAALDMCVAADGTVYALYQPTSSSTALAYYSGGTWTTITSDNFQNVFDIGCDNAGNVYFATASTVMSCAVATSTFTDLKAALPAFVGGPSGFFSLSVEGVLYVAVYGFTGGINTVAQVSAYKNGAWTDVTPADLNASNRAEIVGLTGYSASQIYVATNLNNYVYAGTFSG